jgi:phosphoglycolate phosphatase-like HAD superfamily hydrolase
MSDLFVFDIDGVLLDNGHRLHHIAGKSKDKDWDTYLSDEEMAKDTPISGGIVLMAELLIRNVTVAAVTGRPERRRSTTVTSLSKAGLVHFWGAGARHLHMRTDGDRRPNTEFKVEKASLLADVYGTEITLWVDDHPGLDEAFKTAGLSIPVLAIQGAGQWQA